MPLKLVHFVQFKILLLNLSVDLSLMVDPLSPELNDVSRSLGLHIAHFPVNLLKPILSLFAFENGILDKRSSTLVVI